MKFNDFWGGIIIGVTIGMFLLGILVNIAPLQLYRESRLVERGIAYYDTQTGDFTLKDLNVEVEE